MEQALPLWVITSGAFAGGSLCAADVSGTSCLTRS